MKIAVFCVSEESTASRAILAVLTKKNIPHEVCVDSLFADASCAHTLSFCDCTHCLFIQDDATVLTRTAALCFAAGKQISVKEVTHCAAEDKTFLDFLDGEMQTFDQNKAIEDARLEIIKKGIPVLPDAFSEAVLNENKELVELFFKAGFSSNTKNSKGVPLLCQVVRRHCWPMAYRLIDAGADVNLISDDRGYSALMDAVAIRQPELVKNLLMHNADPNVYSKDGQTALILAVANHDASIARVLLKHGADPDRTDKLGMSARGYATLFNKPELIQLFKNV